MPDSIVSQLLDFGALGIFAGFLIWQHLGMQKRLDKLVTGFQGQLKEVDANYESRIEVMRSRYDAVIETARRDCSEEIKELRGEKERLQVELVDTVREMELKVELALKTVDTGVSEVRQYFTESRISRASKRTKS